MSSFRTSRLCCAALLIVLLASATSPAQALDVYIAAGASMCPQPNLIGDAEQVRGSHQPVSSQPPELAYLQKEIDRANCEYNFGQSAQRMSLVELAGKYAFVCERLTGCEMAAPQAYHALHCTYALVGDLRDAAGRPADPVALQRALPSNPLQEVGEFLTNPHVDCSKNPPRRLR